MINSVNLGSSNLSIASVNQTTPSSAASAAATTTAATSPGDSAQISGPGKLFSELKQLAASDPTKFKAVAADIASKLRDAAGTTGSTGANSPLATLAAKFQQAADTGDVSALQPPSGGGGAGGVHGHHHHHHSGVGTYNQQGQVQPSGGTTTANDADLKTLFDSITQEVSSAVGS